MDKDGAEKLNWKRWEAGGNYRKGAQEIPEDQELIGIYGVKSTRKYIDKMGFITRKIQK